MRKRFFHFIGLAVVLTVVAGCYHRPATETTTTQPKEITLYTYESLSADYGLLPLIIDQFEEQENLTIEIVSFPDAGSMLNQLIAEKDSPKADVVMGLDNINFPDVVENNLFLAYSPKRAEEIPTRLRFDDNFTMTPFDYGYVGFVYDSEATTFEEPISLQDLATNPAYADKIIIEQPGLSSPGTQLLFWANVALGDEAADAFWTAMADQVLTVAPDWSTAYYSMFLNGEAPIVLSYLTSPAYHIDQEDTDRYKAIAIEEGYLEQIEGIGVINGTDAQTKAQAFVDYILSDEVQNQIPTTQWMFPVFGDESRWPAAYQQIITPTEDEILALDQETIAQNYDTWLSKWNSTFGVK